MTPSAAPLRAAVCLTILLASSPAWAHGAGVGLVLGGLSGAVPSLLVGLVHGVLCGLWLRGDERGPCVLRVVGATLAAVVASFVLHGAAEAVLRDAAWLAGAFVIDLAVCALAAMPLTAALRARGERARAARLFGASLAMVPAVFVVGLGLASAR